MVAEGVENDAALEDLRAIGCDLAQGYHVSRPIPPDEFEAFARLRDDPREPAAVG